MVDVPFVATSRIFVTIFKQKFYIKSLAKIKYKSISSQRYRECNYHISGHVWPRKMKINIGKP